MSRPLPDSVAQLPFADQIERLSREESSVFNEAVMHHCCHRERLVAHFYDALKAPSREVVDDTRPRELARYIPADYMGGSIVIACDVGGWYRMPAVHAGSFLEDGGPWTVEVYILPPDFSWLIGYREPRTFLQGRVAMQ